MLIKFENALNQKFNNNIVIKGVIKILNVMIFCLFACYRDPHFKQTPSLFHS